MKMWMQGPLFRTGGMVKWLKETCRIVPNPAPASFGLRKFEHVSNYGKNEDEIGSVNKVADDAIQISAKKWWMPHPETGVFGPEEEKCVAKGDPQMDGSSVLEQHAWFRPDEDVQKQL
ncbi:hypothetical protein KI387_026340 [Taxus chinensis]|uniref:Late embryogenesis abundant protein n=1 Tax=Taxus chinensis TaxID=29808 RepID=A0AA38FWC8_TAXCH|nr:hypothetical protein KI387_026340 [Taxus chinensis]